MSANSTHFTSLMRFVRRNSGRLTFLTLTAGGLVVAYRYFRTQMNTVNSTLEAERVAGARSLRAVFLANKNTIQKAYMALLPEIGAILSACESIDCSAILKRLRERPPLQEKASLWERLKIASVTHLVTAIFLIVTVHVTISMQINLLARYSAYYADAPVQSLPSGDLQPSTSKSFLDLCRRVLSNTDVDGLTKQVEAEVRANVKDVKLTAVYDAQRVECLLSNCIRGLSEESKMHSLSRLPEYWFRNELRTLREESEREKNLDWLLEESLDLCECLDVSEVVESSSFDVVHHLCEQLGQEMTNGSAKGLPFAHLLARFEKLSKSLFTGEIENVVRDNESGVQFAACVFLSGEKQAKSTSNAGVGEDVR